eukprot:4105464-Pyramimonas_sp.AAC.1
MQKEGRPSPEELRKIAETAEDDHDRYRQALRARQNFMLGPTPNTKGGRQVPDNSMQGSKIGRLELTLTRGIEGGPSPSVEQ